VAASFLNFIAVFVLSVAMTVLFRAGAVRWGLVDLPDERKHHDGHVPLCGGLAILTAFALATFFVRPEASIPWNLAIALFLLSATGAIDDRWRLPVGPRLAVHFMAAALIVLPAASAGINFGSFLQLTHGAWQLAMFLAAVVLVVGLINATNMSDGADGLCGGWSAGALFWLGLMARDTDHPRLASLALILLAAVVGFLAFNMRHPWRSRASIFMGDAGSIALGGALAFLIVTLAAGPHGLALPLLAWIVIVPLTDMASLVVRRVLARRSPMSADRWHLHHLLIDMGVPHATAVGLIIVASAACGAVAWIAYVAKLPDAMVAAGLVLPVAAHTVFVLVATRRVAVRGIGSASVIEIGGTSMKGSSQ
jgi:UDP-GlcNAc:undecaprenyl-phosphate GlcNAc-1-phosphate transferase